MFYLIHSAIREVVTIHDTLSRWKVKPNHDIFYYEINYFKMLIFQILYIYSIWHTQPLEK